MLILSLKPTLGKSDRLSGPRSAMATQMELESILGQLAGQDDSSFDAGEAALAVSALDHLGVDLARYRKHLDDLSAAAAARAAMGPAEALADVISGLYEYQGDRHTYDDMKNADLVEVIDRRRGLPVALGILYLAAARSLPARVSGLAFPGHFLMRIEQGTDRVIIDPFDNGRTMTTSTLRRLIKRIHGPSAELEPSYFEEVSPRAIVIRLLMNSRIRAAKVGDAARATELVRRMTLVAPEDARLWAELAELHASRGNLVAAASAFEHSIARAPDSDFREAAEIALASVRRSLN
jgi:regulator of sirC expression with transglutaminase-like and TPR domain